MNRDEILQAAQTAGMNLSDSDLDMLQKAAEARAAEFKMQQQQQQQEQKLQQEQQEQQLSNNNDDEEKDSLASSQQAPQQQKSVPDDLFGNVDDHFERSKNPHHIQDGSLTTGSLSYSIVRAGVAEQMRLNAHSFAATRTVPYLWRWGAFCQLRAEVNAEARAMQGQRSPANSAASSSKKSSKSLAPPAQVPDQDIVDALPLPEMPKSNPTEVRVLQVVSCLPCASFTTHCVAVADTQVKYRITKRVPTAAVLINPSLLRAARKKKNADGDQPAAATHQDFTVEATMVWRTMHFVRHDCKSIQEQGNFEIQSTSLLNFSCYPCDPPSSENDDDVMVIASSSAAASPRRLPLAWAGFSHSDDAAASLPPRSDPIFFVPPSSSLSLRRSCLECYTRPTINFIFAWMLWQNNKELRGIIQRKIKTTTARKKANSAVAAAAATVTGSSSSSSPKTMLNNNSNNSASRRRDRGSNSFEGEDDYEDEEDEDEVTVVDFLTDIKNKIWLNLFDHAPVFAVLGMGANVIANYMASLVPWCDVHVAELDSAVIASNKINGDFPTRMKPELRDHKSNKNGADDDGGDDPSVCGRQFCYHRDVFALLGVPLNEDKKKKEEEVIDVDAGSSEAGGKESQRQHDDGGGDDDEEQERRQESTVFDHDEYFSIIFLDCFDPVSVNMDHSRRVLQACHARLRPNGGILAVNTHLALTYSGAELRPFCEAFPGSDSVQVVSIAGFQQAIIICQKRSAASLKRAGPAHIFGSVREYRAVARVGSTCPVHIKLPGGLLRNVDTPQFFAPGIANKEKDDDKNKKKSKSKEEEEVDDEESSDDDDDSDEQSDDWDFDVDDDIPFAARRQDNNIVFVNDPATQSATQQQQQQQQNSVRVGPRARHYTRSCQCKARWRIADPCSCLMCTTQFLDAAIFDESIGMEVRLGGNKKKGSKEGDDDGDAAADAGGEVVSVRRWLTLG